jgi:hypothetical protein
MTQTFPENYLLVIKFNLLISNYLNYQFTQLFNNYVYYDIKLQSVQKELLNNNKARELSSKL